jgi:hypothetical protein
MTLAQRQVVWNIIRATWFSMVGLGFSAGYLVGWLVYRQ